MRTRRRHYGLWNHETVNGERVVAFEFEFVDDGVHRKERAKHCEEIFRNGGYIETVDAKSVLCANSEQIPFSPNCAISAAAMSRANASLSTVRDDDSVHFVLNRLRNVRPRNEEQKRAAVPSPAQRPVMPRTDELFQLKRRFAVGIFLIAVFLIFLRIVAIVTRNDA